MKFKNLLLTFDYELFLGPKSGSVIDCLINPTNKILEILEKYNVKGVFFVDTLYLFRLKSLNIENAISDYNLIQEQLKGLLIKGHFLFPHIHPHWFDALYLKDFNQWDLSITKKYRFHNLNQEQKKIAFEESISLLKSIVNDFHPIEGYRAGGWCIQPFSDFKPFFKKYGIKFDFSVLKGKSMISSCQKFDFYNSPSQNTYFFENEVDLLDENGNFYEFQISQINFSKIVKIADKFLKKFLWKFNLISYGKGIAANNEITVLKSNYDDMCSIELLTLVKLKTYNNYFDQNDFIHFISHPKMISKHNLLTFDKFLKRNHKKYFIETVYNKML